MISEIRSYQTGCIQELAWKVKVSIARMSCSSASSADLRPIPPFSRTRNMRGKQYVKETVSRGRWSLMKRSRYRTRVTRSPRSSSSYSAANCTAPMVLNVATPIKGLNIPSRDDILSEHLIKAMAGKSPRIRPAPARIP